MLLLASAEAQMAPPSNNLLELPGLPAAKPASPTPPPASPPAAASTPPAPLPVPVPASATETPQAVTTAMPAPAPEPKKPSFLETISEQADKQEKVAAGLNEDEEWQGSIMFSTRDLSLVNQVAAAYNKGLRPQLEEIATQVQTDEELLQDVMSQLPNGDGVTPDQKEIKVSYPRFHLGSILYFKPNHWSIWLNGKRFNKREETEEYDLSVGALSKRQVTLIWKPKAFKEMQMKWEAHEARLQANPKLAKRHNPVVFDSAAQEIRFTLQPGQAFYADLMEVYEGPSLTAATRKLTEPPVTPAAAGQPGQPEANAAEVFAPTAVSNEAALANKLMNQYKNASQIIPIPDLSKGSLPTTPTTTSP